MQQLSISLESRAFGSKGNKTSFRQVAMNLADYLVLVSGAAVTVIMTYWIIVDNGLDWSRTMTFTPTVAMTLFFGAAAGFGAFVFFALRTVLRA